MENNNNVNIVQSATIRNILFVLKKNIIFILVMVVLSLGLGFVYAKTRVPIYTAVESVNFYAIPEVDTKSSSTNTITSMQAMKLYSDTVREFCISGIVQDRANYYFNQYTEYCKTVTSDELAGKTKIDSFIDKTKSEFTREKAKLDYSTETSKPVYFTDKNCAYNAIKDGEDQFCFKLSTSNGDMTTAHDMVRILILAADLESRYSFGGVVIHIEEFPNPSISVSPNVSQTKSLLLFGTLGLALALVITYLRIVLNNTIVDEKELEHITGVRLLTYIEKEAK